MGKTNSQEERIGTADVINQFVLKISPLLSLGETIADLVTWKDPRQTVVGLLLTLVAL